MPYTWTLSLFPFLIIISNAMTSNCPFVNKAKHEFISTFYILFILKHSKSATLQACLAAGNFLLWTSALGEEQQVTDEVNL